MISYPACTKEYGSHESPASLLRSPATNLDGHNTVLNLHLVNSRKRKFSIMRKACAPTIDQVQDSLMLFELVVEIKNSFRIKVIVCAIA